MQTDLFHVSQKMSSSVFPPTFSHDLQEVFVSVSVGFFHHRDLHADHFSSQEHITIMTSEEEIAKSSKMQFFA